MQDLRLIERRDQTLILESEDGNEFYLSVTDEIIGVVQSIQRSQQASAQDVKVSPRQVQTLLRTGLSNDEVASQLEIDVSDVERYAGPIEAEFSFIRAQALGVAVKAEVTPDDQSQLFGDVIDERLQKIGAEDSTWRTWRDPEEGWMLLLTFTANNVEHDARWTFEHRKRLLSPITPDAVNLSKQGDVGDKLIPTLRAVDRPDDRSSFDAAAFDKSKEEESQEQEAPTDPGDEEYSEPTDYVRRQSIDHRAIATDPEPQDLGQTADLLDALRKRRHDRDSEAAEGQSGDDQLNFPDEDTTSEQKSRPINIWAPPAPPESKPDTASPSEDEAETPPAAVEEKRSKKSRASIPSWDEILFGTRSDDE